MARDLEPIYAYERDQIATLVATGRVHPQPDGSLRVGEAEGNGEDFYWRGTPSMPKSHYPTRARSAAILKAVVESSLEKRDVRIIGSKTPGVRSEDERDALARLFPAVRYLFVVRNPYDTINSSINRRNRARRNVDQWHIDDVACAIEEYRENIRHLLAHVARYGDDCFIVKYEDVLERYADVVCGPLAAFLGVTLDAATDAIWAEPRAMDVLRADERAQVLAAFGDAVETWPQRLVTGLGRRGAAALRDCAGVALPGQKYCYGTGAAGRSFLGLGWHQAEEPGVWSREHDADLIVAVPADGTYALHADLTVFAPAMERTALLVVRVGGIEVFRARAVPDGDDSSLAGSDGVSLLAGWRAHTIATRPIAMRAATAELVSFEVDTVGSPATCGLSADSRTLGVCLHSIAFVRIDEAAAVR